MFTNVQEQRSLTVSARIESAHRIESALSIRVATPIGAATVRERSVRTHAT